MKAVVVVVEVKVARWKAKDEFVEEI